MTDHASEPGAVRITNADIFRAVTEQGRKIDRLELRFQDVVKPGLESSRADIRHLRETKADKIETATLNGQIISVRNQTYAIASGLLAGLVALRTLGVI
jgi:hypothetical protein